MTSRLVLLSAALAAAATFPPILGCSNGGDAPYPISSSSSGGGSGGSSSGSNSSGSGGSSSGQSSTSGGGSGSTSSGGSSSGSGSSTGGSSGSGGGSGSSSGGSGSGGACAPARVACPADHASLIYCLDFSDPNWSQNVTFTFGNGKQSNSNGTDDNISVVTDPDKGHALKLLYRASSGTNSCYTGTKGSGCPSGGAEFFAPMPSGNSQTSLFLSYYLKLGDASHSWDWGRAGKLPGLCGGSCFSGLKATDGSGFSARYMWRGSAGEAYFYGLPAGSQYQDLGQGNWSWQGDAAWHQVQMLVTLNTGDNSDGNIKVWYDKPPTMTPDLDQMVGMYLNSQFPNMGIDKLMFSTFFGGGGQGWGPASDDYAYFADFQVCK